MFVDEDLDLNPENKNELKFELESGHYKTDFAYLDTGKTYNIYFNPVGEWPHEISFKIGNSINDLEQSPTYTVVDNTNPYTLGYRDNQWKILYIIEFNLINLNGNDATMVIYEDLDSTNGSEIRFEIESDDVDKTVTTYLDRSKTYKIYFELVGDSPGEISFKIDDDTNPFSIVYSNNPYTLGYRDNQWKILYIIEFNLINSNGDGATMFVNKNLDSTSGYEARFEIETGTVDKTVTTSLDISKTYKIYFELVGDSPGEISFKIDDDTKEFELDITNPYILTYQNDKWIVNKSNIVFKVMLTNYDSLTWYDLVMFVYEDDDSTNGYEIQFTSEPASQKTVTIYLDTTKPYKIYFDYFNINKIFIIDDDDTNRFELVDSNNPHTLLYQNDKWEIV